MVSKEINLGIEAVMMKKKHTAAIASDREVFITCDEEFVNLVMIPLG
jgi:hypothetical protein